MTSNNVIDPEHAVNELKHAYLTYMAALKAVCDMGGTCVPALIAALEKKAAPVVKATTRTPQRSADVVRHEWASFKDNAGRVD